MILSQEQISEFIENGFLVVENVLSLKDIDKARSSLHDDIYLRTGIKHGSREWYSLGKRKKNPANDIFYSRWKLLDIHLNFNVVSIQKQLLLSTYGNQQQNQLFQHPFEDFNDVLCYIDRVCYRIPGEDGLGLHIDRNPVDPYLIQSGGLKKWRPIQSFVCLTDHYDYRDGGLQVVSSFHSIFDGYFANTTKNAETFACGGEFFRMHSKTYIKLQNKLQTIYAPKGSLVMWDYRLPHSTTSSLISHDSREVVYTGILPDISLNRNYVTTQAQNILCNTKPPSEKKTINKGCNNDLDWTIDELTPQQRQLLLL